MRVLVTGGRRFLERRIVYEALDYLHWIYGFTQVVHGAARGVDTFADEWCAARNVPTWRFPVSDAEWRTIGRSAGHRRNARMLLDSQPAFVVAFPGGNGTAGMVRLARQSRYTVLQVQPLFMNVLQPDTPIGWPDWRIVPVP